jgi:hypothetical protein
LLRSGWFLVGILSDRVGLGRGIGIDAAFVYLLVRLAVLMLPETRAKVFERRALARGGVADIELQERIEPCSGAM